MSSNTPASVPVRIVRVSKISPTDDEDLNRLISLCTATSRSNAFICCLLRQPHSDTSHKQYAHSNYLSVLENNNSRVFIAHGTASHNLGTDLGSVWIMNCKIHAPPPVHKLPDFINEAVYRYIVGNMDKQRRAATNDPQNKKWLTEKRGNNPVVAGLDVNPAHPKQDQIHKRLVAFAVAEIRKDEPRSDIVAQVATDFEALDQVCPEAEGWKGVEGVLVLSPLILRSLGSRGR